MTVRILHIVTSMDVGGIETMLMNLFRSIDRSEIVFDFLVHREGKGFYEDEILSLGGKIHRVQPLKVFNVVSYLREFRNFLKNHNEYKIIHSHINQYSFLPLLVASRIPGVVKISHSHQSFDGVSGISIQRLPFVVFCKFFINYVVDYRFACSESAGRWLYGKRHDVRHIKNAIDVERYSYSKSRAEASKRANRIERDLVVGHIGNFSSAKNYPFIIDVFKNVTKEHSDAVLLLIGNNQNNPDVEALVSREGLLENVIFTGLRSDVADLLNAMDVFLFPSVHEGLPVSVIEAQAAGLPCLLADTISNEVKLTPDLEFMSLTDSAQTWARRVVELGTRITRKDRSMLVAEAGYDIKSNSVSLTNFYLELADPAADAGLTS